ncbi:NADH-quinone oxidoreductase subunit I [Pseudonocardia sp. MH-G8]|nr:NADH-quinone oxidoreductase subunit I [Pseudonocardia sp. MH-G8]
MGTTVARVSQVTGWGYPVQCTGRDTRPARRAGRVELLYGGPTRTRTRTRGWEVGSVAEFVPLLAVLAVAVGLVLVVWAVATALAVRRAMRAVPAFSGGLPAREHAVSRFHVRWYPVSVVFLAFDMEMLFMYPWTLVVSRVGVAAVVEMFLFLAILLAGVLYAWREGALRWT